MLFNNSVDNVSTFNDLKRFANEYVIDYKYLNIEELKTAVKKTAPQYSNTENVNKVVSFFELHSDRNIRILFNIIIKASILRVPQNLLLCLLLLDPPLLPIQQRNV